MTVSRRAAEETSRTADAARRPAVAPSNPYAAERRGGGGRRRLAREHGLVIGGWLGVLLVVSGTWQYAATQRVVDPVFTGMPTKILAEFLAGVTGRLVTVDTRATVTAAVTGFAIASVIGISCAFVLAQSDVWRRIMDPYFTLFNGLPRVALAPLFLLWFGIGILSKVVLAASITFFVTFYNTMAGVDSVDRDHILLARALGASRSQVFLKFVVPSAIPSIFAGLQLGFVYGMLGTVTSEMLAGEAGLGVVLTRRAALFETDAYFATLLVLALVTTAISGALEIVRRHLLRWQRVHMVER